ncbi:MAG: winged helix DNA-binding domain-containing protein, partial [Actinocrinis sp.]
DELCAMGRELLDRQPMTNAELRRALAELMPGRDRAALQFSVHYLVPVVQVPPAGLWGAHGQMPATTAETWLSAPMATSAAPHRLILRYLAAFGPAAVADMQAWSGLTRLREVVDELRPELVCFGDESGRELFDVPDAPLPGPDGPAPVRFLPEYDNLMVAYKDRRRMLADAHCPLVFAGNAAVRATVLVDGFVAGTWKAAVRDGCAQLSVEPFGRMSRADRAAVTQEGLRLLTFVFPGAQNTKVDF